MISYQVTNSFLEVWRRRGTISTCKGHLNLKKTCFELKNTSKYVFMLIHIDTSCRTVVQVIFASFRTASCKAAVLQRTYNFGNNSFKSGPLQTKLIPKLNSNVLNILTSKREGKTFKQHRNKHFSMVHIVLMSTSWQYLTVVCSIQHEFCKITHMDNS